MFRTVILSLTAALALAGCSAEEPDITENDQVPAALRTEEAPTGEPADGEQEGGGDTWVAVDIDFAEAPDEVATGTEVMLINEGQADHNVTIEDTGDIILDTAGGGTDSTTLDLPPGEYRYICSVPGHAATMNGTLVVTE